MEKVIELKMTPITEGLPKRDAFRGEQTILTYCETVGTWDLCFYESGWGDFDAGFALGVTHWLDISAMWPGITAQITSFRAADSDVKAYYHTPTGSVLSAKDFGECLKKWQLQFSNIPATEIAADFVPLGLIDTGTFNQERAN